MIIIIISSSSSSYYYYYCLFVIGLLFPRGLQLALLQDGPDRVRAPHSGLVLSLSI